MILLACLYFTAYLAFAAWVIVTEFRSTGGLAGDTIAEIPMDLLLLPVALSYWIPPLRQAFAGWLLPMYCAGVAAFVVLCIFAVRKQEPDTDLSQREEFWLTVAAVFVTFVVTSPALAWGFLLAVLGRSAGA